jgi:hypothetical protein
MREFEIKQDIPVERQHEAILFSYQFFSHTMKFNMFNQYLKEETIWDKSWYLVDESDTILGIYLMGEQQIPLFDERFTHLFGVEGLLLAVDESIRGFGFGNRLKDLPRTLGVDYIWGQQFKILNNLDDWLKRRFLVGEMGDVYITAEIF